MANSFKIGHFETPGCYPGVMHVITGREEKAICGTHGGFGSLICIDSKSLDPALIDCKNAFRFLKKRHDVKPLQLELRRFSFPQNRF